MKTMPIGMVSVLGFVGCWLLGCSGPEASCGAACAGVEAGAGASSEPSAPEAGAGGEATDGDPGASAGEKATAGGAGGSADDASEAGAPASEPAQWIVYVADEETPGKNELYAIRVADLGQPKRIKIGPELDESLLLFSSAWSPDGKSYAFQNAYEGGSDFYIVRFRDDGVDRPALVAPNLPSGTQYSLRWSPSGSAVLLEGEEGVVVAEPDAEGNYFGQKLGYVGTNVSSAWKDDDTIIHSVSNVDTEEGVIFISEREQEEWVTTPLVYGGPVRDFSISADGRTLAYYVGPPGQHSLFAQAAVIGSPQRTVQGSGAHVLYWSPIRADFLLVDQGKAAWGMSAETSGVSTIPGLELGEWSFSPDGSRLEFWEPISGRFARLGLRDFAQSKTVMHDVVRNLDDSLPLAWAPDGSSYVSADQRDPVADVDLVLGDPTSLGSTRVVDTVPNGDRFSFLHYSDSGEFLVYDKEHGDTWETSYLDLRGDSFPKYPPVKIPGEGLTWTFEFEPGGSNATYTQRLENGAEPCFFLDLSRQVAKAPVQVSGEGRVEYCVLQPRAK